MDNLPAHKVADVHQAIEARGAFLLYLTAYSPDLNPIELAFAKLKVLLSKAVARFREALWKAIAEALDRVNPGECRNLFLIAGYASNQA